MYTGLGYLHKRILRAKYSSVLQLRVMCLIPYIINALSRCMFGSITRFVKQTNSDVNVTAQLLIFTVQKLNKTLFATKLDGVGR